MLFFKAKAQKHNAKMLKISSTALPPAVQLYVAIKHKINDRGEDCT